MWNPDGNEPRKKVVPKVDNYEEEERRAIQEEGRISMRKGVMSPKVRKELDQLYAKIDALKSSSPRRRFTGDK